MAKSPWARAWMRDQREEQREIPPDYFGRLLLAAIVFGVIFMFGLQIGLKEGKQECSKSHHKEAVNNERN